jgi:CRP-like cAMP-binding protein
VVTVLEDGSMVEVATVGREGMVGVSAVLNGDPPVATVMVQAETDICYRLPIDAFRGEMDRRGAFHDPPRTPLSNGWRDGCCSRTTASAETNFR